MNVMKGNATIKCSISVELEAAASVQTSSFKCLLGHKKVLRLIVINIIWKTSPCRQCIIVNLTGLWSEQIFMTSLFFMSEKLLWKTAIKALCIILWCRVIIGTACRNVFLIHCLHNNTKKSVLSSLLFTVQNSSTTLYCCQTIHSSNHFTADHRPNYNAEFIMCLSCCTCQTFTNISVVRELIDLVGSWELGTYFWIATFLPQESVRFTSQSLFAYILSRSWRIYKNKTERYLNCHFFSASLKTVLNIFSYRNEWKAAWK